jgi:hypothetical protein
LHENVREIQRDIRFHVAEIKELQSEIGKLRGDENAAKRQSIEEEIKVLEGEMVELEKRIPAEWKDKREEFVSLLKEETKLRTQYRRAVDGAYTPVQELMFALKDTGKFVEKGDAIKGLSDRIQAEEPADMVAVVQSLEKEFGEINGPGDVKKALSKVRRALRAKTPDKEKALAELEKANAAYVEEVEWRTDAAGADILPKIQSYEASIRNTIGIRQQSDMPRDLGLFIASCNSGHRDVSLNF